MTNKNFFAMLSALIVNAPAEILSDIAEMNGTLDAENLRETMLSTINSKIALNRSASFTVNDVENAILKRKILNLFKRHSGVYTTTQVAETLQISIPKASSCLTDLAFGGLLKKLRAIEINGCEIPLKYPCYLIESDIKTAHALSEKIETSKNFGDLGFDFNFLYAEED